MKAHRVGLVIALMLGISALPALALELGDDAPPLKVDKWIKGGPINLNDGKGKNLYVIEFWATWCRPCRESIPHLTELQKKYKDKGVVVVGVSVDKEKDADKTRAKVEEFVEKQGGKMDYAVALDTPDGDTSGAYRKPFLINWIPCAFIVTKQGKLYWQGDPTEADKALDAILAGKFDLAKAKKEDQERRAEAEKQAAIKATIDKYLKLVASSEKPDGAEKLGAEALEAAGEEPGMLNALAWTILTGEDVKYRDLKLALKAAERANKLTEGKEAAVLDTYARALFDNGKVKEAIEAQTKAVKLAEDKDELKKELEETLAKYKAAEKK